jgi:hypothetical protein
MQTIHLEWQGKSTRVTLQALPKATVKITPTSRTSSGQMQNFRVINGLNPKAAKLPLTPAQIAEGDPELDTARAGQVLTSEMISAAYYDPTEEDPRPVAGFKLVDHVFDAAGQETGTRPNLVRRPNLNELAPIKMGKRMPLEQALFSFVFKETRQIVHTDGLSYDFLYNLAKELHTKKEVAALGAGPKGNQALVLKEKGTALRGFLYGEIGTGAESDRYKLLLLLSDQELKIPALRLLPKEEAAA